jgi:cytochrome c-type biogenesis protein CcmF
MLNNVLLVIAAGLVFLGTLAPLVVDVMNAGKISVGPPWFQIAFAIPMIPLVLLMGLGMHTAWRTQAALPWAAALKIPAIIAVLLGIVIPGLMYGRFGLLVSVGSLAAIWILVVSMLQPIRSWRRPPGTPGITRAVLGMSVAHFGIGLFTLGVTLVSAFNVEEDIALRSGQTVDVAGYNFELREIRDVAGPNYSAIEGVFEIREDGEFIGELRPQKRQYLVQKNWMTEAGILALWNQDIFVALGDQLGNDTWSVRIQYKPMIRFIWLGALVMALGGLIAISDKRYRAKVPARSEVRGAATEAV